MQGPAPAILVAEDNPINQEVILEQLGLLGYRAELAQDGVQAFERWQQGRHALLLTDLQMPGLDGCQLARAVRAHEAQHGLHGPARTRIVALSANNPGDQASRCRQAGIDELLAKPLDLDELQARLQQWLPKPAGRAPPAAAPPPVQPPHGVAPVLDADTLRQYVGDDADTLAWFRAEFARRLVVVSEAMVTAWHQGRHADLGGLAHQLKSAARTVGALHLGQCCEALEHAARDEHSDAVSRLWPPCQQALADTEQALAAIAR